MMKKILTISLVAFFALGACTSKDDQSADQGSGDCPLGFGTGHKKDQVSIIKNNKDWWPNKLNVDVLAQNS